MSRVQRCQRVKRKSEETSRRSEGMDMAPAITLKRMYHCVPSSMRAMEPMPRPPPILTSPMSRMGKKAVAGTEARTCATGWTKRASLRIEADGDADGDGPGGGDEQGSVDAEKGCARAFEQQLQRRAR